MPLSCGPFAPCPEVKFEISEMNAPAPKESLLETRFWLLLSMIVACAALRLVPGDIMNFKPVGAIALFAGACFASRRAAAAVTFLTMLVSDVFLYVSRYQSHLGDALATQAIVYAAFALILGIGFWLRSRRHVSTVVAGSLAGSILFFLVSNVSSWLMYDTYPMTANGLLECYAAGLPFFRTTLVSDLFFSGVLFGTWALLERRVLSSEPATV